MKIDVTEAEVELIVEALARYENDNDSAADTLYRRLISTYFRTSKAHAREEPMPTCDGCGAASTSMFDADGNHLCHECGKTLTEPAP